MGSFFNKFYYLIYVIIFLIIFISCFFTPIISEQAYSELDLNLIEGMEISERGFIWPIPGYTKLTSYFGKRTSPTAGASSYHKGIDIGAPEGTKLIAVVDGTITFTGFLGGGGYTITLSKDNMKITYCHVSPTYIVEVGQEVVQGQVIGFVGPKNVYGVARKSI
jgi:murein DD-endopeptidase MepM/ murein hydrolase activator NlpD